MKWFKKKDEAEFDKQLKKSAPKTAPQPDTFIMCFRKVFNETPDWSIQLKRHRENHLGTPMNVIKLRVRDIEPYSEHFDEYILEHHGGGNFVSQFLNSNDQPFATYTHDILGVFKKIRSKKDQDADGDGDASSNGKKKKADERLMDLFEKMVDRQFADGGGGGGNEMLMDYLLKKEDNALTREEGAITTAGGILQLINSQRPQIPPEDASAALYQMIGQLAPAALQFLSARAAGQQGMAQQGPPQQAALGALGQMTRVLQSATPEELRQLQPLLQKAGVTPAQLAGLTQSAAPPSTQAVNMPAPGQEQATQPPASQVAPDDKTPPEIPAEHMTFHVKLGQLRQAASDGSPPEELADMIIALVESSRLLTPENPHPLLRELTQSEPEKLPEAMTRFFQNIPELSADAGLQQAVGKALWKYATGEDFQETEEETDHADIPSGRPAGVRSDGGSGGTDDSTQSGPPGQGDDSARPDHEDVQSQVA